MFGIDVVVTNEDKPVLRSRSSEWYSWDLPLVTSPPVCHIPATDSDADGVALLIKRGEDFVYKRSRARQRVMPWLITDSDRVVPCGVLLWIDEHA